MQVLIFCMILFYIETFHSSYHLIESIQVGPTSWPEEAHLQSAHRWNPPSLILLELIFLQVLLILMNLQMNPISSMFFNPLYC